MTTSPTDFRSTVRFAKNAITLLVLVGAPVLLMAEPEPFASSPSEGYVAEWTTEMAEQFPACQPHKEGDLTAAVVVIHQSGDVRRMSTDAAFAVNADDERANDIWVVGSC
jgi:hypothetical protein